VQNSGPQIRFSFAAKWSFPDARHSPGSFFLMYFAALKTGSQEAFYHCSPKSFMGIGHHQPDLI